MKKASDSARRCADSLGDAVLLPQVEDGGGEEDQQGVRAAAEGLLHVLDEAVRRRVDNIPPPPPPLLSHPGACVSHPQDFKPISAASH